LLPTDIIVADHAGLMEEGLYTEALKAFRTEIMDELVGRYSEEYAPGEEMEWHYRSGGVQTCRGPAVATVESSSDRYEITGHGWRIGFETEIEDRPYHIEDIVDETGSLNLDTLSGQTESFDPEKERTRTLSLSPREISEATRDRWSCFNQVLEDVLEPEETYTEEDSFHYLFDLRYR